MKSKLSLLVIGILFGCQGSVLVPDPVDPRLPMYTERGNNVAGAFINGDVWISQVENHIDGGRSYEPEFVIYKDADSATLVFSGLLSNQVYTEIKFDLKNFNENSVTDLTVLSQTLFALDGVAGSGEVDPLIYDSSDSCRFYGQIIFKSVRKVDDRFVIISGTFGLFTGNGCTSAVTYGRFDFELAPRFI
jgi:hypothetical protein